MFTASRKKNPFYIHFNNSSNLLAHEYFNKIVASIPKTDVKDFIQMFSAVLAGSLEFDLLVS